MVYDSERRDVFARRAAGVEEPVRPPGQLTFDSRFESGNLASAVQLGDWEYELKMAPDYGTRTHTQWFLFAVAGMTAGAEYTLTIVNFGKPKSTFAAGQQPVMFSERAWAGSRVGWVRIDGVVQFFSEGRRGATRARHCLRMRLRFPAAADTVYLAHSYPFTVSMLSAAMARTALTPPAICRMGQLCTSNLGLPVPLLAISDWSGLAPDALCSCLEAVLAAPTATPQPACALHRGRRGVVITARVHPGEVVASWMADGLIAHLLSPAAAELRAAFVFAVVPMLNPDGVLLGNYRCDLAGVDLNRAWLAPSGTAPTIAAAKALVARMAAQRQVMLFADLHGHSRSQNVFAYGCSLAAVPGQPPPLPHEQVYPYLLAQTCDMVAFESCSFGVPTKAKEGTARAVISGMGICAAYTIEATFCGATHGSRAGLQLTPCEYREVGAAIARALEVYADPEQTAATAALAALLARAPSTCGEGSSSGGADNDAGAAAVGGVATADAGGRKRVRRKKVRPKTAAAGVKAKKGGKAKGVAGKRRKAP